MTTLPIPIETLEQLCEHRRQALQHYQDAINSLLAGNEAAQRASPTDRYVGPGRTEFEGLAHYPEHFVRNVRQRLDRSMWRHMMKVTSIGDFMDATARKSLADSLENDPPEATADNVAATLMALAGSAPNIIKRGVVELFQKLDRRYAVNRAFKIGSKVKLSSAMLAEREYGYQSWSHWSRGRDHLIDLERTLFVIDGRKPPAARESIVNQIESYRRGDDGERFFETDELAVRWFKNGNVDVTIKRDDLIAKLNQIIAEYFGETLPDDRRQQR